MRAALAGAVLLAGWAAVALGLRQGFAAALAAGLVFGALLAWAWPPARRPEGRVETPLVSFAAVGGGPSAAILLWCDTELLPGAVECVERFGWRHMALGGLALLAFLAAVWLDRRKSLPARRRRR